MEKENIAIVGGGISGLSVAKCLNNDFRVKVFEKDSRPGGLVKCDRINGNLYHKVGGHVFNSRRQDVLDWFWQFFNRDIEFSKAVRNSSIYMPDGKYIAYPIENHIYMMEEPVIKSIISDILSIVKNECPEPANLEEFLYYRFGDTLYKYYFQPYNEKIWRKDLKKVPLSWLGGKLPMPTPEEIIYNNFNHVKEMNMVHSTFFYPKNNGSQFLADRLAGGTDIAYNIGITLMERTNNVWLINGEAFDKLIFCGNVKDLPRIIKGIDISSFTSSVEALEYHGTTSVLCEIDENPFNWVYLPNRNYLAHRVICTGNFAKSNSVGKKLTATIEFTDYISEEDIDKQLQQIPFTPKHLAHSYTQYTYPIQNEDTREMLGRLKELVLKDNLYLLGRFAEWEYYNMDAAMGAAIDLSKQIRQMLLSN
ncbi:MAG: NAD(P)-binding protein [Prevotellaceae bacterium]|jgi:protoporphyrinogen oxidase|nr:NAD(P)-binding protein [Prevotellaceae bacterium]